MLRESLTVFSIKMKLNLQDNGFKNVGLIIKPNKAKKLKDKIDFFFKNNLNLGPAVNIKNLAKSQMVLNGESRKKFDKKKIYLNKLDFKKGTKFIRKMTNGVSIKQPILNLPELINICTDLKVVSAIQKYFQTKNLYIGYVKVRRFFKNRLPEFDTNFFHYDDNGKNLVKLVLYLNNINSKNDGPFVYVINSKTNKPKIKQNKINKYMIPEKEVSKFYGKKLVKEAYGVAGSGFLADTIGFHKGIKNTSKDRYVVYINYVTNREYNGKGERLKISSQHLKLLKKNQQKLFKFFEVI